MPLYPWTERIPDGLVCHCALEPERVNLGLRGVHRPLWEYIGESHEFPAVVSERAKDGPQRIGVRPGVLVRKTNLNDMRATVRRVEHLRVFPVLHSHLPAGSIAALLPRRLE